MASEFERKIREITRRVPELAKRLPGIGKVEGLQFIADNFSNEGFEEKKGQYKKWDKKKTEGARKKTLMGEKRGGSLKQSWKQGAKATGKTAEFASSLPYAQIHNEGGRLPAHDIFPKEKKALKTPYGVFKKVRFPGADMPERRMIGDSLALADRIDDKFKREADKLFNK